MFINKIKTGKIYIWGVVLFFVVTSFYIQNPSSNQQLSATESPQNSNEGWTDDDISRFFELVTDMLISQEFNGNVYISKDGKVLFDRCLGFADFRNSEPLNRETVFQLASISKTFTAAGILLLQEDSLLSINDKVKKHIPEFPYSDITIKHFLTHTSGIQNYMFLVEKFWKKGAYPTNEDVLQLFIEQNRPLNFTPGNKFEYSNTGFVMLALIIERVSKQSYAQYLEGRIFNPLELNNTFVYDIRNKSKISNRAYGFRKVGSGWRFIPDDNLDAVFGDKGIFSNINDLLKWDNAMNNFLAFPSHVAMEAFEFHKLPNDSIVEYGYGWRLQNVFGIKAIHHPGRWKGFRTSLKRYTNKNTTLIILSNNNTDISDLVDTLQALLFKEEREKWLTEQILLQVLQADSINKINNEQLIEIQEIENIKIH
jgi:CubicO group peptidase (beta-lactamase class C family)